MTENVKPIPNASAPAVAAHRNLEAAAFQAERAHDGLTPGGLIAIAQANAMLAVAHELRTANLLTYLEMAGKGMPDLAELVQRGDAPEEVREEATNLLRTQAEHQQELGAIIRERLGRPGLDIDAFVAAAAEAMQR